MKKILLLLVLIPALAMASGKSHVRGGSSHTGRNPNTGNYHQQATNSERDSWYQPTRSPEFDPDLFGGD
jgi:hypothetical protein